MFDMDKFVPEKFLALEHDPESANGLGILIEWDGFPKEFNSIEPIDSVFQAMPNRVLRWLSKRAKEEPEGELYEKEYTRLLKSRKKRRESVAGRGKKRRTRK